MGAQMSVETGAKSTIRRRCAPNSHPFRNCSSDKSGSFAEAEAYHSFYRKLARRHFNPRAPMGRDRTVSACALHLGVSTHAPYGRDHALVARNQIVQFSTHAPLWGATAPAGVHRVLCHVSTHAPREGRDYVL